MPWLTVIIVFLAVFTQSLTGFGSALVSMAVLPELLGIQVAAPLVALMAGTLEALLLVRYWRDLNLRAVWRLAVASVIGIPIGVLALRVADERLILTLLGMVLAGYALYALRTPNLPQLKWPGWAFGFGFAAGLLGGAYNTAGPPVIVYGNSRRWSPAEFKCNLQGIFLIGDALVIAGHAVSQNLTSVVWNNYLIALPAMGLGIVAGLSLEKKIDPAKQRRIVLWLLLIMGVRLILA